MFCFTLEKSFDFSLFLQVYEGNQGWPFIEEGFYKLLIDTILSKQKTCVEDKVNIYPSKKEVSIL
jgi:hypothetical protein